MENCLTYKVAIQGTRRRGAIPIPLQPPPFAGLIPASVAAPVLGSHRCWFAPMPVPLGVRVPVFLYQRS